MEADPKPPYRPYLQAAVWTLMASILSYLMFPFVDLANIALVYQLSVVLVGAKFGRGPAIAATALGAACFEFLFVPKPQPAFLSDQRFLTTFVIMACVGVLVASLGSRWRAEALETKKREVRSQALYRLSRELASAESREDVAAVVREHMGNLFGCESHILEYSPEGLVPSPHQEPCPPLNAAETATARMALSDRTTCKHGDLLFLPMVVANESVGLVCSRGIDPNLLASTANLRLLDAFANNAAIALHRLVVADAARATQQRIDQERLRNVMLSSMSHDFRTPLASITGAITTLIDSGDRLDEPTRADLMQSIRQDADFLERQVRNLLDLTKLESGQLRVRREWHPMDEVVGGAMTRVEATLEGRHVEIDVSPDLPLVAIDALLIERMLVNLLENAAHYTPASSPIEVAVHQHDQTLQIVVADRGPGIPPGQEEKVFDKFYRVGNVQRSTGAGLGLAICRAIVELHEGRIWVENRPGGGAAFRVELPLVGTQPAEPPALTGGEQP